MLRIPFHSLSLEVLQMVARYIVPLIACLLLSVLTWGLVEKVRPNFGAILLEDEGRQKGGFSTEMHDAYRFEKLKCNSVSFGIWGACLAGFTGFFGNPHAKRRWLGLVIGLVLGALSGPLGAYLGQLQELRTEYSGASATYWIIRWGAIAGPMGVSAAIAAAMSGSPKKQLVECVLGGILGIAIGVVSISLLHGAITQLEKPENIFPGWTANRVLAVFCVNIAVFAMILLQAGRHGPTGLPNNMKTVEN